MAILLLGGVALIFSKLTAIVDRLLKRGGVHIQSEEQARRRRLVVVALAVPWLLLFAVAEPGVPERFLWLLPLQVLVLAAFFAVLLPRLGVPRPAVWLPKPCWSLYFFGIRFWSPELMPGVRMAGRDMMQLKSVSSIT